MAAKTATLACLLFEGDRHDDDITLICPVDGNEPEKTFSRSQFRHAAQKIAKKLIRHASSDRQQAVVAFALENSVALCLSLVGCMCLAAAVAPLNPAYTEEEFCFYLKDTSASLLVLPASTGQDVDSPALKAAQRCGIATCFINLRTCLLDDSSEATTSESSPLPSTLALLLHTSGTTGKPKCVPLTHGNLASSALNVIASYDLQQDDRAYLVQVLFHIHGLVAGLLAPLISGGSLVVPTRFNGHEALLNLLHFRCTWLTGTPSALQMLLLAIKDKSPRPQLRFIRSCSSPLLPTTFRALQKTFKCPIVEAYAMTENAHQITTNSLVKQLAGSVGKPGSIVSVAIFSTAASGAPTKKNANCFGEVCIRGPTVTSGYLHGAGDTQTFFEYDRQKWFRTGDRGRLDEDGVLHLAGRYSEIINRGGEKISPPEVDEALMLCSSLIQEAACFSVPDAFWGQEVEAAVVLREAALSASQIQDLLKSFLAPHKIPKRIHFCEAKIPKGPTGKIQRNVLSKQLGKSLKETEQTPFDVKDVFQALRHCLHADQQVLLEQHVTLRQLGVDSLMLTRLVMECARLGYGITIKDMLNDITIGELTELCRKRQGIAPPMEVVIPEPFELLEIVNLSYDTVKDDICRDTGLKEDELEDAVPLTQQQSLYISRFDKERYSDTNLEWLLVGGAIKRNVDMYKLQHAFRRSMRWETQLRTYLVNTGRGVWLQVHQTCESAELAWQVLTARHKAESDAQIAKLMKTLRHRSGIRACFCLFVEHSEGTKEFYIISSHIITDNISRNALLNHVAALYADGIRGESASAPARPLPWSVFAKERIMHADVMQEGDTKQLDGASTLALSTTLLSTKRHTSRWSGPITALSKQFDVSISLMLYSVLPLAIALYEAQAERLHRLPTQVQFCIWTSDRKAEWAGVERVRGMTLMHRSFRIPVPGSDAISAFLRGSARFQASDDADTAMTFTERELASRFVQFNWRELDSAAAWKTEIADGVQTSSYASATMNALYAGMVETDTLGIYAADNTSYDEYRQQHGLAISLVDMMKRLLTYICAHAAHLDHIRVQDTVEAVLTQA